MFDATSAGSCSPHRVTERSVGYTPTVTARSENLPATHWSHGFGILATRAAQLLLVLAALAVIVWMLTKVLLVVIPALLAVMVAAAIWPLVKRLRDRGWPDPLAAIAAVVTGLVLLSLLVWIAVAGIYGEWGDLKREATSGLQELQRLVLTTLPIDAQQFGDARDALIGEVSDEQAQAEAATGGVLIAAELLTGLVLFVVVLFFLLKDGPMIWPFLRRLLPPAQRARAQRIGEGSFEVLGGFVRGTAIVAAIDAVVIGIALALLGVPLALPLAIVVFIGAFVPIIGATAAGAIAALVALVANGPVIALVVVGVVLLVNQLEGDLIAPYVLGNAVALHPLAVLLALASGAIAAGVIGALLAVPLVAVAWAAAGAWEEPHIADAPPTTANP